MTSPYGIRGNISPEGYFKENKTDTLFNGFKISIDNSTIEVGYAYEEEIEEARLTANCF